MKLMRVALWAAVAAVLVTPACSRTGRPEVVVSMYSEYIDPQIVADFEATYPNWARLPADDTSFERDIARETQA